MQSDADGWTNVPTRTKSSMPERVDSRKLQSVGQSAMSRASDPENMQLGPGSRGVNPFTSWGKGSGSRSQTKEEPTSLVKPNRFAAFSAGAAGGSGSDSEDHRRAAG